MDVCCRQLRQYVGSLAAKSNLGRYSFMQLDIAELLHEMNCYGKKPLLLMLMTEKGMVEVESSVANYATVVLDKLGSIYKIV